MKGFNFYRGLQKNRFLPYSPSPLGEGWDEVIVLFAFPPLAYAGLLNHSAYGQVLY